MSTMFVKVEVTPPRKKMLRCMKMSFGKAERGRKAPVVLRVEHDALPATPPPEFYSGKERGKRNKRNQRKSCVVTFASIRDGDGYGHAARTAKARRAGGDAPAISGVRGDELAEAPLAAMHERLRRSMHSSRDMQETTTAKRRTKRRFSAVHRTAVCGLPIVAGLHHHGNPDRPRASCPVPGCTADFAARLRQPSKIPKGDPKHEPRRNGNVRFPSSALMEHLRVEHGAEELLRIPQEWTRHHNRVHCRHCKLPVAESRLPSHTGECLEERAAASWGEAPRDRDDAAQVDRRSTRERTRLMATEAAAGSP